MGDIIKYCQEYGFVDCSLVYIPFPFIIYVIFPLIAYLIGSIPFGLILVKIFSKTDIRKTGSGNIGATNVLRTGHKFLAFLTLFLDAGKGVAVAFCGAMVDAVHGDHILDLILKPNGYSMILSFFVILGHCYPVWLKFKGGKGVATTLGVLLVAAPWAGFVAVCTWGIVAGFFRISSLAALCAVAIAPLAAFLIYSPMLGVITILIALLVFWRHKGNIDRLLKGEEPKIGAGKKQGE